MSDTPVLDALERQVRAQGCRELAAQLDQVVELLERLDLRGWARHFAHDAELLRVRANREDIELVVE